MSDINEKRARAANFTRRETELLMDLVFRHIQIIENKKTDSLTWRRKDEEWETISQEFNSENGATFRSAKILRSKYDTLKKKLKKKETNNKLEIFKTGGGRPNLTPLTEQEEKLSRMLTLPIDGLSGRNDCDDEVPHRVNIVTAKEPDLETGRLYDNDITTLDNIEAFEISTNEEVVPEIIIFNPSEDVSLDSADPEKEIENNTVWSTWNPKQLKTKKTPALQVKTTKKPRDILNSKYESIASSREELLDIQMDVQRKELLRVELAMEQMKEKHAAEMENLQLQRRNLENEEENLRLQRENLVNEERRNAEKHEKHMKS